jgi:DNA-binding response OmpR family regulator
MEVLKAMRRDFEATAVLALTGRNQMEERVLCLDLGADDCMLKPFSLLELTARCRALLRRREHFADPMLRFGGVEINRMDRSVRYEGVEIVLTVKEYLLLEFLLKRKGGCCSRAELLTEVWQSTPGAGTNIVDVYITYLRRKFAAARRGESPRGSVIETVRGSGYRIRDQRRIPRMEPAAMLAALQTAEEPEHIELPLTA